MGRLLRLLISIVVMLLVGGSVYYYAQGYVEKKSAMRTVEAYNKALSEALESSSVKPLASYATRAECRRVQAYIFFNYSQRKFMRSNLIKINYTKVKVGGKKAEISAEEEWSYQYLEIGTKKPLGSWEKVKYKTKYKLSKNKGRWLVSEVRAKEIGEKE